MTTDQPIKTIPLRRELDGTVYAYRCAECGGQWKVYQNPYHLEGCKSADGKPPARGIMGA